VAEEGAGGDRGKRSLRGRWPTWSGPARSAARKGEEARAPVPSATPLECRGARRAPPVGGVGQRRAGGRRRRGGGVVVCSHCTSRSRSLAPSRSRSLARREEPRAHGHESAAEREKERERGGGRGLRAAVEAQTGEAAQSSPVSPGRRFVWPFLVARGFLGA
jgi:hypothetical protein